MIGHHENPQSKEEGHAMDEDDRERRAVIDARTAVPIGLVAGLIVSICIGAFWFGSCYQSLYGRIATAEEQIQQNRDAVREINEVKCTLARIETQLAEIVKQTETRGNGR